MKILKYLSYFFSVVFHPLFIALIGVFVIFNMPIYLNYLLPPALKKYIILLLILSTILVPLIITLVLQMLKIIKTTFIDDKKERIIPYIATLILYGATYYMLTKVPLPRAYYVFIITSEIAVLAAFIINFFTKISSHMVGLGGLTAAIFIISMLLGANLSYFLIGAFIMSGIVAASRLYLKAHTPLQIILGFAIGFAAQFLFLII